MCMVKGIDLNDTKKVQLSPQKYRYLEWTEGRGHNGIYVQQLKEKLDKYRYRDGTTERASGPVYYR